MKMTMKNSSLECVWHEWEGCKGLCIPSWQEKGAENLFTSRLGGVSEGAYTSLNLGLHVEDDPERVCRNREIIAQKMHILARQMVYCEQVHGVEVQRVGCENCGQGVFSYEEAIRHTDALITNEKQVYLTLLFADCIPLFFFDPEKQAIGLAHGGWKGAWGEIGVKTIAAMQQAFHCQVQDIQCWIGPGIGPCCFEIGEDLAEQVKSRSGWDKYVALSSQGKYVWDLKQTHGQMLQQYGVLPENIVVSEQCTSCHAQEFFSYRRDHGKTGRMAAILGLQ